MALLQPEAIHIQLPAVAEVLRAKLAAPSGSPTHRPPRVPSAASVTHPRDGERQPRERHLHIRKGHGEMPDLHIPRGDHALTTDNTAAKGIARREPHVVDAITDKSFG